MDNSLERTGKTVEEAIELAILELGVGRDEVEVDVINQGRAGILGIGAEPARVRVSLITGSSEGASAALAVVDDLLEAMDVDATPSIRTSGTGPDDPTVIDIQGEDAGLIIGRRGETLRALQYIANIVLNHRNEHATAVVVDVEQYRERRRKQVAQIAARMAERAVSTGQPVTLDPMTPADRRVIHMTLADDKGVTTQSTGDGNQRRVVITPTGERTARPRSGDGGAGGRRRRSGGGGGGNRRSSTVRDDRD